MTQTLTQTTTFNRSHARYVATKVAADLRRMQHLYGWPTDRVIEDLIEEITEMLALDYLKTVEIGFERDGKRVLSLKYESRRVERSLAMTTPAGFRGGSMSPDASASTT